MQNILVAIDFEEQAEQLISQARLLARPFNSKVWLVHVAAPNPDFVGYEAGPQVVREQRADTLREEHQQLQHWADDLQGEDIQAEALLIQGPTVKTLLDECRRLSADLIIIGAHHHGWLYQALMGSTTDALMHGSQVPTLVVPLG